MFPRLSALWLIVIIALPCTAPFSTCEFSDFLAPFHPSSGHLSRTAHLPAPADPARPDRPSASADCAYAPPLATAPGRLRVLLLSAPEIASVAVVEPARVVHASRPIALLPPRLARPQVLLI